MKTVPLSAFIVSLILAIGLILPPAPAAADPASDAAVAQLMPYLDEGHNAIAQLAEAIASGDLTAAQAAYARARVPWETIEVTLEGVPEFEAFDGAIDAREDDFVLGVNDPEWTGFHRIERGLFAAQSTDGLAEVAYQLLDDWDAFAAEFRNLAAAGVFTPEVLLDGVEDLLGEVAQEKIVGEEERYSKLDLLVFQANLNGARAVFDAYRPEIEAMDPALATLIANQFEAARASIAPFARSATDVTNYDQVPQAARSEISAAFRALSRSMQEAMTLFD
jgi:iron uptake system component EfeO